MELKGKLHRIYPTKQVAETFRKREFVIEYAENPQYPEFIKLELIQDNCDNLDGYDEGQMVEVDINVKGRSWKGADGVEKFFNTLQAWRIRKQSGAVNTPPVAPIPSDEGDESDLPF